MVVDPKVVGGGAAVVAIGGGSGYAISQAVSSSNDNQNSSSQGENNRGIQKNPADQENTLIEANKKVLNDAGFTIDSTQAEVEDCKNKLKLKAATAADDDDFKNLVDVCYKNKKFSDKATSMGLDVLTTTNLEAWNTSSWWDNNKTNIKTIVTELSTEKEDWEKAKTDLSNFCTSTETTKGNKTISKSSTDAEWKNFLKACTKDKANETKHTGLLNKNFWTGK